MVYYILLEQLLNYITLSDILLFLILSIIFIYLILTMFILFYAYLLIIKKHDHYNHMGVSSVKCPTCLAEGVDI